MISNNNCMKLITFLGWVLLIASTGCNVLNTTQVPSPFPAFTEKITVRCVRIIPGTKGMETWLYVDGRRYEIIPKGQDEWKIQGGLESVLLKASTLVLIYDSRINEDSDRRAACQFVDWARMNHKAIAFLDDWLIANLNRTLFTEAEPSPTVIVLHSSEKEFRCNVSGKDLTSAEFVSFVERSNRSVFALIDAGNLIATEPGKALIALLHRNQKEVLFPSKELSFHPIEVCDPIDPSFSF